MGNYAVVLDVQARVPYRDINATTSPSTTQVDSWIDHAESMIDGALLAGAVSTTPLTGTHAINILRELATDYAEGRLRSAFAAAGGDATNDDGLDQLARFDSNIQDMWADPQKWSGTLLQGSTTASSIRLRSHASRITDGSNAPIFKKGGVNF